MPPLAASVLHLTEVNHDYAEASPAPWPTTDFDERIQGIIRLIDLGADLTPVQVKKVHNLIRAYHRAFALNHGEVEESPPGQHTFDVDPTVRLPQRAMHMRMHRQEEQEMTKECNKLLDAGILQYCPSEKVKCVSQTIMVRKKETYDTNDLKTKFEAALDDANNGVEIDERPEGPASTNNSTTSENCDKEDPKPFAMPMVHNYKPLNRAIQIAAYLPGSIHTKVGRHAGKRYLCVLDQLGAYFACALAPRFDHTPHCIYRIDPLLCTRACHKVCRDHQRHIKRTSVPPSTTC